MTKPEAVSTFPVASCHNPYVIKNLKKMWPTSSFNSLPLYQQHLVTHTAPSSQQSKWLWEAVLYGTDTLLAGTGRQKCVAHDQHIMMHSGWERKGAGQGKQVYFLSVIFRELNVRQLEIPSLETTVSSLLYSWSRPNMKLAFLLGWVVFL